MKISQEVLVERIDGLRELINQKFEDNNNSHDAILAQVTKTNGRVNCIEAWKSKVTGALIVMNVLLIPIALMFVQSYINNR
jgi:hypothetical protein